METERIIRLAHGSGGLLSHQLTRDIFQKYFHNDHIRLLDDAAILAAPQGNIVMSTDSFVVDPVFFPGGDIGSLSICGTVNDLAVSGGIPLYLSAAFILEEGLPLSDLEIIVASMADTAKKAQVTIVAGDTKVVERGKADKIFINTTGIGSMHPNAKLSYHAIQPGDHILINGTIAEHGVAILSQREGLRFASTISSDAKCLHKIISGLITNHDGIHFMRDPTRGGVATVLAEIAKSAQVALTVSEQSIPIRDDVAGACEILGIDPLYMANEGKFLMICNPKDSQSIIQQIRAEDPLADPRIIGKVESGSPMALMETRFGGTRILDMLPDEILPRIC